MTTGIPIGLDKVKHKMSNAEYCDKIVNGAISEPAGTAQTKSGFIFIKPIFYYLNDGRLGNCSVLMY